MRKVKVLVFTVLVFIFAVCTQIFSQTEKSLLLEKLDIKTLQMLMAGNKNMLVMEKKGAKYSGGERYVGVIVNAPFEKCWNVVADVENYKDFVPMMTESKLTSKKGDELVVDFTVEVKFLGIGCTEKYQQKYKLNKGLKIIELIDMKTNKVGGGWRFIPIDKDNTIMLYQDRAPIVEEMCWTAKMLVKTSPDSELALHASPPFVYISAMKERMESKK